MKRREVIQEIMFSFICFRKGIVKNQINEKQLPHAQAEALFSVAFRREMSVGELAEHLNISSGAATQLVEALVQNAYLHREHSTKDRRIVTIKPSAEGLAKVEEYKTYKMSMIDKTLSVLNDDELSQLSTLLNKISKNN